MAANGKNCIEYAFDTLLTTLATDTTLATSARHNTAAKTFYIPETSFRAFLSVKLVCSFSSMYAATNSVIGWRVGIKLGAAATLDTDLTPITAMNTANRDVFDVIEQDVTSYFNSNFTGTSQSCIASLAVSTTTASVISNVTFKLVITYEANTNGQDIRINTVRIPIQSIIGGLTTSHQELGIDGTNPSPANQVPALDTFLPEGSKAFRQIFVELTGNTSMGAATTYTPYIQIDGTAEVARSPFTGALVTSMCWKDIYDLTGIITTSAAHAIKMRSSLASRIFLAGGWLVVTYEYSISATQASSNRMMISTILPMVPVSGTQLSNGLTFSGSAADALSLYATLDIQENNPTLVQSGLHVINTVASSAIGQLIRANGQAYRTYTPITVSNESPYIHRCDHGTLPWSLTRGVNKLKISHYTISVTPRNLPHIFAVVNYTADLVSDPSATNRSLNYQHCSVSATATATTPLVQAAGISVPSLGTPYKLSAIMLESYLKTITGTNGSFLVETLSGEWLDAGFINADNTYAQGAIAATFRHIAFFEGGFNKDSKHMGKMQFDVDRKIVRFVTGNAIASWSWWVTGHRITFIVSGTITVAGSPAPSGKPVQLFALNSDGSTDKLEAVNTGAGGTFTFTTVDNTRQHWVEYSDSVAGVYAFCPPGLPGGVFDIAVAGGGGGDVVAPIDSVISPISGFSNDYQVAKNTPIILWVRDASSNIAFLEINLKFSNQQITENVYSGAGTLSEFNKPYQKRSTISGSGAAGIGYTVTILRDDGWPKNVQISVKARATDAKGNLL